MKKKFCVTFAATIAVFTNIIYVYGENDSSSTILISQVEAVDYVLYAGAALFLLGMVFILLALFLKQSKKIELSDEELNSSYNDDGNNSSVYDADIENITDSTTSEEGNADVPNDESEKTNSVPDNSDKSDDNEIEETNEEDNIDNMSLPDEQDTSNADDNLEDAVSEDTESEPIEAEVPSTRVTFTGTNNADLKILDFKGSATIGRKSTNDLMISDNAVSGIHCKIYIENDEVYIEDLGSTNGTILNGTAITKEILKPDDLLVLGKTQYKINIL